MGESDLPRTRGAVIVGTVLIVAVTLIGLPIALIAGVRQFLATPGTGADASWVTAIAAALLCGIVALGGIGALVLSRRRRAQARRAHQIASADVLLRLDERFRWNGPAATARRLQEAPSLDGWGGEGPESPDLENEWCGITEYVRLFEPVYVLVRDGSVPVELVRAMFGYRISQIVQNKKIVGKIVGKRDEAPWSSFLPLWEIVDPDGYRHWTEFLRLWRTVDANGFSRQVQAR